MNRIKNIMKHIVDYHNNDINYNNEYEVDMIYQVYKCKKEYKKN